MPWLGLKKNLCWEHLCFLMIMYSSGANLKGGEEGAYQSVGNKGSSVDGYSRMVSTIGLCDLREPRSDSDCSTV